ncbi:MAG: M66 family metalloprotease [Myxococcota bacterium]
MTPLPRSLAHRIALAAVAVSVAACGSGKIGPLGSGDPDGSPPFNSGGPGQSGTGGNVPPGDPTDPDDPEAPLFTYASVGTRCVGGALGEWLVLSRDPVDCAAHADFAQPPSDAFIRVPLSSSAGPGTVRQVVPVCSPDGACVDREIEISSTAFAPGESLRGAWSLTLADRVIGGDIDASRCNYEPLDNPARAIRVSDVVLNQGVAVALAEGGSPIAPGSRNAPVVAGRDAVVQIGVAPEGDWLARELIAEVRIGDAVVGETRIFVDGESTSEPQSMIQVPVAGAQIPPEGEFSIGLYEVASCVDQPGAVLTPRVPSNGAADLAARPMDGPFRIVLVPIRWNADGSGRLPDLSASVVGVFADRVRALYPVDAVDVSVRAQPLDYDGDLDAAGNGWSQLLNTCLNLRADDDGPDEVYYYCVFQPTNDIREFCGGSCVAGIGPVPSASDTYRRGAIGFSYGASGVETFVHEIGHALGRPHAPCGGVSGADPNYPYSDATIGVWGYDLVDREHIAPNYRDMMSYCGPSWISDYNYELLFDRIESVYRAFSLKSAAAPVEYLTVIVDADMSLSWGESVTLRDPPEGQPVSVDLFDDAGTWLTRVPATYQGVTHIPGGSIKLERPPFEVGRVDIEGFGALPR